MDLVKRDWHIFSVEGEYFLFNSLGSLYQLDEEGAKAVESLLKGSKDPCIPEDVYEEIEEVLTPYDSFNIQVYDDLTLKSLCLNVSHSCNMVCDYCFVSHNLSSSRSMMDLETAYRAIDFLIEASKDTKNIEIDFFGGEPLLNLDAVRDVSIYGKKRAVEYNKNLRITLTTNGILLTEKVLNLLDELEISVVLSLDGGDKVHNIHRHLINGNDSFKYILPNAIELARRREYGGYYIRGTYTAKTITFSETFKDLIDLGFRYISLEPVVTTDENLSIKREHIPILREEYKKIAEECLKSDVKFFHFELPLEEGACLPRLTRGCGAGIEYMAVTPTGEIYPCHQFVGYRQFMMGNIYEKNLNKELKDRFKILNNIDSKPLCKDCWTRYLCGGGCLANNFNMNRNITEPYEIGCEIQKLRIEYALWLRAKRMEVKV
ncbi:MAG: SPASM domain-containing protein [bacterium]|nr:SPASM domain-containing protein [bacterium]